MATKSKTWSQLITDLNETFRKWYHGDYAITNVLTPRERMQRYHTPEERTVKIEFTHYDCKAAQSRRITLMVKKAETAPANLELITKALEHIRMADSRGITELIVVLYRQMYPQPQPQAAPPPPKGVGSSGP